MAYLCFGHDMAEHEALTTLGCLYKQYAQIAK